MTGRNAVDHVREMQKLPVALTSKAGESCSAVRWSTAKAQESARRTLTSCVEMLKQNSAFTGSCLHGPEGRDAQAESVVKLR